MDGTCRGHRRNANTNCIGTCTPHKDMNECELKVVNVELIAAVQHA